MGYVRFGTVKFHTREQEPKDVSNLCEVRQPIKRQGRILIPGVLISNVDRQTTEVVITIFSTLNRKQSIFLNLKEPKHIDLLGVLCQNTTPVWLRTMGIVVFEIRRPES